MADPPKPIKNSLLSAATGSSFFEEAAMFVPVPLAASVGSQEPATAEIDLNSDDSSPNRRASIETDFTEQLRLDEDGPGQEAVPAPAKEEVQPVASLFSRAATTGGDLFSRMLAGSSSVVASTAPDRLPVNSGDFTPTPVASQVSMISSGGELYSRMMGSSTVLQTPSVNIDQDAVSSDLVVVPKESQGATVASTWGLNGHQVEQDLEAPVVNLFTAPSGVLDNPSPVATHTEFLAGAVATAPPLLSQNAVPDDEEVGSAASLFASGDTPFVPITLVPPTTSTTVDPFTPMPSAFVANQTIRSPVSTTLPISTTSAFQPPRPFPSAPVAGPVPTYDNEGIPLTRKPGVTSIPAVLNSPPVPLMQPTNVPTNLTSSFPPQPTAPAPAAGPSNSFRLGAQRMKYVPCPEMQAAPIPTSPPNMQFNPMVAPVPAPSSVPTLSTFTPIATMGAVPSMPIATGVSPQQGYPPVSQFGQPPISQVGVMSSTTAMYGTQSGNVQSYIPHELPPLTYQWFYRKDVDGKITWKAFSLIDSVALEDAFANHPLSLVPTDGGRYDVSVEKRLKMPVYWEETPIEVRRGSWFFKGPMDNRFVPYDDEFAARLEKEFADCVRTGAWQKRLEFPGGESVIMHSSSVVVHFCQAAAPDDWGNLPESQLRPRVVKRGVEEIEVEDGESTQVDHLVFVVHGIGPICDFKLRNIVEAVDDFRGLSLQLLKTHFDGSIQTHKVGRVEFLPVSWHKALRGDKGIDEQLKRITLRSIPKFRDFTNDTLLDILFYTSPVYCQTIIDSVGSELNRIYKLFLSRNPTFVGNVSLIGHSLGSLILFDLLAHQPLPGTNVQKETEAQSTETEEIESTVATPMNDGIPLTGSNSRTVSYTVGTAGTGQPYITYPRIDFRPTAFFALGSPIAMFVTIRGIENLGNDFRLPTCGAFFNIFHPYDPVAYRMETLIDPDFQNRPVLIPHHKGRKRIHLELKETMARVGADIKHKVIDAVKSTINNFYHYTGYNKTGENIESEIQTAVAGELERKSEADGAESENAHIRIGSLNGGRRIDHVLQEAPYETFNEYVFAMSTHVGYWESEDTMLLVLSEIYGTMGISKDQQILGASGVASPTMPTAPTISNNAANYYAPLNQYDTTSYQASAPPMQYAAPSANMNNYYNSPGNMYATTPAVAVMTPPQPVPMVQQHQSIPGSILLPPNPVQGATTTPTTLSAGKPQVIGNRPVVDPSYYPRGMDPTAPMLNLTQSQVAPPPKAGFVPKQ